MSTNAMTTTSTPVWRVEHHPDEWEAVNNFNAVHIEEACTDGLKILREVNPEEYQMSTEVSNPLSRRSCHITDRTQTRVVCIKTQFVENMQIGIKNNLWCTSDKVGEKISLVWREHDPSREKVLLLFSIAKQRAYCALGEMTGPWEQTPSAPSGWIEKQGSFEILGYATSLH